MNIKSIVTMILTSVLLIVGSCTPTPDFDENLGIIIKPHRFSLVNWEFKAMLNKIKQLASNKAVKAEDSIDMVLEYYSLIEQIKALKSQIAAIKTSSGQSDTASLKVNLNELEEQKAELEGMVELVIGRQITETLAQQGIFNPVCERVKIGFPPLNFELETPPRLLVISPRDRIESMREVLLKQASGLEAKEDIEDEVDQLGVSSLVVSLGGLAAYPSFIAEDAGLRFTIDAATEEWLHQYLAFKPLGFHYVLDLTGVARNYDIATMNETLASMVSKEIGTLTYEEYYARYDSDGDDDNKTADWVSGFNQEIRNIRKLVDEYLAHGEIEQAEKFMEQKRQYLASKGYHVRKLNQAYFAFYGTYADSPTSVSPIGLDLKELRNRTASLKDFLNTVAAMTNRHDLEAILKNNP